MKRGPRFRSIRNICDNKSLNKNLGRGRKSTESKLTKLRKVTVNKSDRERTVAGEIAERAILILSAISIFTRDDFLFFGPGHRFDLCFSNKSLGMSQTFLLI